MSHIPDFKCQKFTTNTSSDSDPVHQAKKRLGPAFHVIEGHQPSQPSVTMREDTFLIKFTKEVDGGCDSYWTCSEINSMNDDCLLVRFSMMTQEEIYDLLNNLNELDPEMYLLLKKLLTGEENDESIWKKWIEMKIVGLPPPYYFGLVEDQIQLSDSQTSILENHKPQIVNIDQPEKDLLTKFYTTNDLMPGYKFARYGALRISSFPVVL